MQTEMTVATQVEVIRADTAPIAVRKQRIEVDLRPFLRGANSEVQEFEILEMNFSSIAGLGLQTTALGMLADELADVAAPRELELLF